MNNETKELKNAGPEIMVGTEAKLIYLAGEDFDASNITLWRIEDGKRQEITAQELVNQGNVYPSTSLTGEVTDILFTWDGDETYLPIVVKKVYDENSTPATKTLPLTPSVNAKWFPATGEMATTFTDVVFDKTPLNFALKHVHINNDGLYSCGRSWKLNLHRFLRNADKENFAYIPNAAVDENDYIYTDEFGNTFSFDEVFYYMDNGKKIICDKKYININSLGKITYKNYEDLDGILEHPAEREFVTSTGLKLVAQFKNIKGIDLFDQRNEDVASVEEEIKNLKQALSEIEVNLYSVQKQREQKQEELIEFTNQYPYLNIPFEEISFEYIDQNEYNAAQKQKRLLEENLVQIDKYITLYTELQAQHQDSLIKAEEKLETLRLLVPVAYLVDSEQLAMGFNHLGQLCALVDKYNNAISVVWEKIFLENVRTETITGIYEGDYYTKINYDAHALITSIVAPNGEEVKYEYSSAINSNLTKVIYPDGKVLQFIYDDTCGNGKYVTQVTESDGHKCAISYNHYKPQLITTYSCAGDVTNGSTLNEEYQKVDEVTLCNKTMIGMPYIVQDGLTQTIFVNEYGAEIGGFAKRESQVYETPLTFSYYDKQNKLGYTITEEVAEPIEMGYKEVLGKVLIEEISVSALKPHCRNFVFSATSTTDQDLDWDDSPMYHLPLIEEIDDREKHYRLLAELLDENYEVEETYQVSINPQNRIVKATALPITLLPTTQTIKLYAQYDGESTAYFKNLRFAPCSWQKHSYDDFGNIVSTTTSQKALGIDENNQTQYAFTQTSNSYNAQNKLTKSIHRTFVDDATSQTIVSKYQYCNHGNVVREETYVEGKQATDGVAVIERVCDEHGNVVKEISYNSLDSSSKFYTESNFDETGKVLCQVDETGENKTTLVYKDGTTQVQAQALPNGSTFAYGTDESGNVTSITHSTSLGEENSTNTNYTHGLPTKVTSGNNVVDYTYDYKGRVTKVAVNGEETTYTYLENTTLNGITCDVTTVNSRGVTATAYVDKQGKTLRTVVDNVVVDSTYDQTGKLLSKGNLSYTYDELDRLTCVQHDDVTAETYTYDKFGRTSGKTIGEQTYIYTYVPEDEPSGKLQSLTLPNGAVMKPLVDVNGRNKGKELLVDGNKVVAEHLSYRKVGDHATNQPSAIYFGDKANGEFAIKGNLKYKYDEMGNVTHVFQDGMLVCTYTYDKLSRLIREDNKKLGKTFLYSYDNCGNMLSRRIANYTTKPTEEIEFSEETLYSHVGDRLVAVNGESLSYDNYGRLLNYKGKALTWQSNRLSGVDGVAITYDAFGRRVQKGATTFTYDSNNNLLTAGNLSFFYDTHGIAGFVYNGATYYYRKNIQGDVIALITADGTVVATYTYDAWGNCVVATDTNGIGETNPIRYRGYYWDEEFGLYFLQSRYYSPELGRFISQDSIEYLAPENINGLNLYAYCLNNPISYVDPTGHSAIVIGLIIGAIVGAAIGFGTAAYIDYKDDLTLFDGDVAWYDYVGAIFLGGAVGAVIGAGLGAFSGISFSATLPTGFSLLSTSTGATALVATGTITITVTGAEILSVGALAGIGILFAIPKHGQPNSRVQSGGSYGEYDENGNLSYRVDTTGRPHFIKSLGRYYLPHTHKFTWRLVNGVWRFIEEVLPFLP